VARGSGRSRRCRLGGLALAGALAAAAPLAAQEAAPGAPVPIPLAEVTSRAEEVGRFLREVAEVAARDPEIAALTAALPESRADVRHAESMTREELEGRPSRRELADLQAGWKVRFDALAAWKGTLGARASGLETQLERLEESIELWTRTRAQAREAGAPAQVLERIQLTRRSLRETREAVRERLAVLLTLQDQVAQQEQVARAALEAVGRARAELRGRLFERDAEPLWRASAAEGEEVGWGAALRQSFADRAGNLRHFGRERSGWLQTALGLFLAATLAAFWLRGRARAWPEGDPRRESAALVSRHPVASALLVVLFVSPLALRNAPQVVSSLAFLLFLFPALVLLRALLPGELHRLTYALAGFFLVDRLRDLADGVPWLERTLFAAELAAALALLLWLRRPGRRRLLRQALPFATVLRAAVRVAPVLLGVALGAELLGFTTLAHLLGEGVLGATYLAVALHGGLRVASMLAAVALRSHAVARLHVARRHAARLEGGLGRGLAGLAVLVWVFVVLDLFAVQDAALGFLRRALGRPLEVGEVSLSLGDLLGFALAVLGAVFLSRGLRFLLEEEVYVRAGVQRGAAVAISSSLHYALLFLGILLGLAVAGVDFGRITLLAGALGIGVGFGLQTVVNNFVSGLLLLFERPVKVGDTVEVGSLLGDVTRIGIRSSTIRTFDGAEVIVPNANLVTDQVINWTLSDRQRRVDVGVGVRYGTDPRRVMEILLEAARSHPRVLAHPAPTALFRAFGDSALEFQLRAWVASFEISFEVQSDLNVAVNAALTAAGIEIPFPQRDLHLRSVDAGASRRLAAGAGPCEAEGKP
jgi:small-conductance mechanosensitive channel